METTLVEQARKGNQGALAQLLYDNYEIVYKYLIKFTLNSDIAADMAQDAMVKAIEKFELYDADKSKFSTWLITIARNYYLDYLRKRKHEKNISDTIYADLELPDPESRDEDEWNAVLEALARLSEDTRFPLLLKHYYGYALEDIARMMSIPLGTVKSRIHNGLKALRKELE